MKTNLLKVLIGSHSHDLARPDSDYDYRAVYVTPTTEILSLGHSYKGSSWMEGEEDNTAYEIGHFLHLATKCNPTILEVFKAPVIESFVTDKKLTHEQEGSFTFTRFNLGEELRGLFPYVWNPKDAFNAFLGYSLNQRKKLLDDKDRRGFKYATAYIRTLYNLIDLLEFGTFDLKISESRKQEIIRIRDAEASVGEIINLATVLTKTAEILLPTCKHEPDITKVNEFLLKVRKEFW